MVNKRISFFLERLIRRLKMKIDLPMKWLRRNDDAIKTNAGITKKIIITLPYSQFNIHNSQLFQSLRNFES